MPLPKVFPPAEDLTRIKNEHEFYKLYSADVLDSKGLTDRGKFRLKEFFSNDEKKAKILDIALHLAPAIVDAATDFLLGEPFRVEVDGGKHQEAKAKIDEIIERNDLQNKVEQSSSLFQAIGHHHFKLYKDTAGKAVIEEVPYNYYFPNWDRVPLGHQTKNVRIVVYMNHTDESGVVKKYIYVEDWYFQEKTVVVAKSLWEDNLGQIGNQVALSTLGFASTGTAEKEGSLTQIEQTGLTELPFVDIDVRKTVMERFGHSVFTPVLPLLYEVNDRLTQLSIQFLKHLNAKLQMPSNAVVRDPKTGKVQQSDLEVILAQVGDPDTKYITNDNPLIEQAFDHLESCIRKIAKLTQTPDSFLTEDEKGGVEKAEALKTRLMHFLKKVTRAMPS